MRFAIRKIDLMFYSYYVICRYNCDAVAPSTPGVTNCTARPDSLCLGNRRFLRKERCNWTSGYSWGTALVLSITLGGFGADRSSHFICTRNRLSSLRLTFGFNRLG